jgi:hypothetical protein
LGLSPPLSDAPCNIERVKVWPTTAIPVRITVHGIEYKIRADMAADGSGSMNLEAARLDNHRSITLQELPVRLEGKNIAAVAAALHLSR